MKSKPILAALIGAAVAFVPVAAAQAATTTLVATLSGANEPAGGDPDGTGTFSVEVDADAGDFCYTLTAAKIAPATMAHVHSGAAGVNGPPVGGLEVGSDICIALEPELLKKIVATPGDYYVNVHNAQFPNGAIRGQLQAK